VRSSHLAPAYFDVVYGVYSSAVAIATKLFDPAVLALPPETSA
jgi:hypothetical protein